MKELCKLWENLVRCPLNCDGITNDPKKWIIPRCLFIEEWKKWGKSCIVIWLNPWKSKNKEQKFYIENWIKFETLQNYFNNSWLKNYWSYYKPIREIIYKLWYNENIIWTELVKCECSGKNWTLPLQTLRTCINRYLRKEINMIDGDIIFAVWKDSYEFCSLSFPNHFIVWITHPASRSWHSFKKNIEENLNKYIDAIKNHKNENNEYVALDLSKI